MPTPSLLAGSLIVALGGALGAWLRYLVGHLWTGALGPVRAGAFPYATLTVNVLGSLAMGLLVGWLALRGSHSEGTRLFLAIGVLGGFTTFSSFSLDIVALAERGQMAMAAVYALVSLVAGVAGLLGGMALMRSAA